MTKHSVRGNPTIKVDVGDGIIKGFDDLGGHEIEHNGREITKFTLRSKKPRKLSNWEVTEWFECVYVGGEIVKIISHTIFDDTPEVVTKVVYHFKNGVWYWEGSSDFNHYASLGLLKGGWVLHPVWTKVRRYLNCGISDKLSRFMGLTIQEGRVMEVNPLEAIELVPKEVLQFLPWKK